MSKFSKKAASFGLIFAAIVFVSSMAPVQALTIAERQAQIDALLVQIQTIQADLAAQGAGTTTSYTFTKNLTLGTTDAEVQLLQQFLNANDYIVSTSGAGSVGSESTYFGTKTKAALIAFQTAKGLNAVGFFGPLTRATIAALSTTTYPAGCTSAVGFSTTTGLSCATVTPVTTFPAGCTSAVGFSTTTGLSCAGTVVTFPAGCTSAVGFSPTTGLSCAGVVAAIGAPLTVTLASDTPSGANILMGSANNVVTKLVFTAGNDADVNLTGLTVKSYGTANINALDIATVKIFDGTKQVGMTQTQINGSSNFVFAPSVAITKGTSKVLDIVVDVQTLAGLATPSATIKLGVELATKVIGATFTGTFPVVGNSFTVVAGGQIGVLTVTPGAPVPTNTTYVGAKDVVFGNFIVTAGTNEDVKLTQFNIRYGASAAALITDSDVSNLRIKVDNAVVGGPASFTTRRATIDLTTPVTLTKGTSKTFSVIGDVASGAVRNIELDNAVNMVNGLGITSGVGVTGGGPLAALGAPSRILIAAGRLAISVSTTSPAGASAIVVRSITPQVLGVYDVRAVGEEIMVNNVGVTLNDAANDFGGALVTVSNVGLYDEAGALLSNQITYTAANMIAGAGPQIFALNWPIPANTTKKLYIKGTTSTLTGGANVGPNVIAVTLANIFVGNTVAVVATGMSSSGIAGANNITLASALALPALTINATATYLAVPEPTTSIYNQAIISPAAEVTLGYLRVTAQNEDQTLDSVVITNTAGVGAMNAILSGVAIFDGNTAITAFNAPNNGSAAGCGGGANTDKVCFANVDILTPLTFTLNTPKVLKVVGSVLALAPVEIDQLQLQVAANELRTLGKSSGQFALNTGAGGVVGAIAVRTNIGAYNETGTFGLRTNVVEIKKDAASPSGSVRGTFKDHGIWDFTLNGTAANADVGAITFTSQVGLPNVVGNPVTPVMFRLYDYTNSAVINVPAAVNVAAGTVTFANIPAAAITLTSGQLRKLSLQVTTTDVPAWPVNTSLQWSIRSAASVQIGSMGTLVGAGPDLASAGAVTQTYVGVLKVGMLVSVPGGGAFAPATSRLYYRALTGTAGGVVELGDTLLWAPAGWAFAPTSVVVAANPDLGIGTAVVAADALTTTNAVGAVFVPGVDGIWTGAAPVAAGDTRLVGGTNALRGLNWAGAAGYGGTTWSFPADANTVTLP